MAKPKDEAVLRKLGLRLRELRDARPGLTQERLAELAGFQSHQTISNYERGRARIGIDQLVSISDVLGIGLAELVDIGGPVTLLDEDPGISEVTTLWRSWSPNRRKLALLLLRAVNAYSPEAAEMDTEG